MSEHFDSALADLLTFAGRVSMEGSEGALTVSLQAQSSDDMESINTSPRQIFCVALFCMLWAADAFATCLCALGSLR